MTKKETKDNKVFGGGEGVGRNNDYKISSGKVGRTRPPSMVAYCLIANHEKSLIIVGAGVNRPPSMVAYCMLVFHLIKHKPFGGAV